MTIQQSLIQFGDYIMPIGTMIKSTLLTSTVEDTKMLGIDGSFAPSGSADGATIQLAIELGQGGDVSPSTTNPLITMDDANDEANRMYSRLNSGYQQLKVGTTPARYIMAQKRKWQIDPAEGTSRAHLGMSIDFFAQDPRWLSVATNSHAYAAPGAASLTNAGSARSYPLITFTAGTNPGVRIHVPNPPIGLDWYVEIDLAYTIGASETLIIDCDPRNRWEGVRLKPSGGSYGPRLDLISNIVNTIGTSDTFPFMDPGASNVEILGTSSVATVTWNDAWGVS